MTDIDVRADLIAAQLQTAVERAADEAERERLAAKVTELETANAKLTMAEAARQAGLNLEHQTVRFFMHYYDGPPDPERILTDFCTKLHGKPPPMALLRRLQRSKPQPPRPRARQWGEFA